FTAHFFLLVIISRRRRGVVHSFQQHSFLIRATPSTPQQRRTKMRFFSSATALALGVLSLNTFAVPVQQSGSVDAMDAGFRRDVATSQIAAASVGARAVVPADVELVPRARVRSGRTRAKAKPKSKSTRKKKLKSQTKPRPTKPKSKSKGTKAKPKTTPKKKPPQKPWEQPVPSEATITRHCKVPKDKALFWSGMWPAGSTSNGDWTPKIVLQYAAQKGLKHDESVYPKGYVRKYTRPNGKPYNKKKEQLFAQRFSKVFARKARGVVHVMVPWKTGPKAGRVFARDEWPILKRALKAGRVTRIVQVNPADFGEVREYDPKRYGLVKRDGGGRKGVDFDVDLDNIPWDVNLDALEAAWRGKA
ncbi:hypothetical protein P171DRAFT_496745, partial [Karstenula rhodostoma CBS 690.94]